MVERTVDKLRPMPFWETCSLLAVFDKCENIPKSNVLVLDGDDPIFLDKVWTIFSSLSEVYLQIKMQVNGLT